MLEEPLRPGAGRGDASPADVVCFSDELDEATHSGERISTGIADVDTVLGGGLTVGSVGLIAGEPGIGKSTLLLQLGAGMSAAGAKVLYASGEESASQVRARATRLGIKADKLYLVAETDLDRLVATLAVERPQVLLVDSVQTMFSERVGSGAGSVSQVRETAARLVRLAKATGVAVILVGHVTKDGSIAGPKVLEHMVDTVLSFDGDSGKGYRMLRAIKNRFGATNEFALLEMKSGGLAVVKNPSALLIAQRPKGVAGSLIVATAEGARPLLVELQALVSKTSTAGSPRRVALGIDPVRLALLLAVAERRAGVPLSQRDVFVNIVGGVQVAEPATDLGVVLALVSSLLDQPVDAGTVAFGEVGLAGEVRSVERVEARLREASSLGFVTAIIPGESGPVSSNGLRIVGVRHVVEALDVAIGFTPREGSAVGGEVVRLG